eukprot:349838-Chlamydomonas_euryale.AAC.4
MWPAVCGLQCVASNVWHHFSKPQWAPFHRAFAPCEGVIHTKNGASVFHRKGGTQFRCRLPYPASVRPLGEALTPRRVLPTFQPGVRPYARCQAGIALSFTHTSGSDKHAPPYEKVH